MGAVFPLISQWVPRLLESGPLATVLFEQHPRCEGTVRDRIIFEETIIKDDHFNATKVETSTFEVEAGEIHGVQDGTEFKIYRLHDDLTAEELGTGAATKVGGRSSTVSSHQLVEGMNIVAYSATIIEKPTLNYIVRIDSQTSSCSSGTNLTSETLLNALTGVRSEFINEVKDLDDAVLEVCIKVGGGITLRRRDKLMHQLRNVTPRIQGDGLKPTNLAAIFRGIARFNYFLPLTNQEHPLADRVSLEMCRLIGDENGGVFPVRPVDADFVVPADDISGGHQVTDIDDYVIILRNSTNLDLHIQVWYFDPDEYSITPLYQPANIAQATLPQGGELQLGASTELPWPLSYYVPKGAQTATLFAKVFLTDSFVKLRSLQQSALIGPDTVGDRNPGEGNIETKGLWDTILLPITVVRAPSGSSSA